MYEYLIGTVTHISPEYIVLENGGIGYQIITPNPYLFTLNQEKTKVFTYFYVREDAQMLYGFQTREERIFFRKLLNVSGIGPKGALAILASGKPSQIASAIEEENEKFLTSFPGVGKKTARQIILDLKGKLQEFLGHLETGAETGRGESINSELQEALLALKSLGYSQKEIEKIKPKLQNKSLSADQYIRLALQNLSRLT
ncbi:Holliday junction branch migration protein RuvA [Fervidibacillus halotolerans]|uniref:Holliday junction branch migration complex subunit RuvA n=1 Tax=Fervidibacillus halotolerans TaxID=2980027 RepID=A0A9E8LXV8_9BACI|nr:Holliday junction branch migration protein RuvA [Fervidibacillus halotolerans]WAA11571.1 Holliday junction branch migration protein RuvA [Fervidibacillus halotolerans]